MQFAQAVVFQETFKLCGYLNALIGLGIANTPIEKTINPLPGDLNNLAMKTQLQYSLSGLLNQGEAYRSKVAAAQFLEQLQLRPLALPRLQQDLIRM